ncbi:HNH endonuclease [Alkalihalophilus pseudofirmus]|uniref:HNH endonuclease n=1 Tax=Alkalihalophilus pseudofirmus TaxID=79885 RepID=UPI00259BD4C5|nr:HNH endonuclease [Alkalihalophilus pseudofirmus]WEG18939.1 HNH endonuclease [Alkalihalophilus pseudofirmus]
MTIPKNINREHILKAIKRIKREGIPWRRQSTKYNLLYENNLYPPKYVLSIANFFANGEEYSSYDFNGGNETNVFLEKIGFLIVSTSENIPDNSTDTHSFQLPILQPVKRIREYNLYEFPTRDRVVYEYLFHSRTHRWLDEHAIGLNPEESRGYQAMGILHYIGLRDKHKGIFENFDIDDAIKLLEQQDSDFTLLIHSLQRYHQQDNGYLNTIVREVTDELLKLESIVLDEQLQIEVTEKEQLIKSRIGQSTFKKALLLTEKKCKLCGMSDERFLIASHIKPWRHSSHQERLDVNNGLLLCPNHDALFDRGDISFDQTGDILISDSLDDSTRIFLNINENMKIRINKSQLDYMIWHRNNLYKPNNHFKGQQIPPIDRTK